ncbi:MAG: hypothetical protein ACD_3C00109G0001 [uncultured bacterium (gcode 4)]|uniref:Uncharacterized protein n=1 Tax=uncultured bacterium (gcode 4) TaxID=1234023 RepID=K2G1D2_9BACT|nr:MAG: hypothetical protein ACD_3C00109G0001 [uncultured bacterium (gcode 4)]
MKKNNLDDITRLLALEFDDLAWELGHSPDEARSIVDSAVSEIKPSQVDDLIWMVSGVVSDKLESHKPQVIYSDQELWLIVDLIKGEKINESKWPWTKEIMEQHNLFCTNLFWQNILMAMVMEWQIDVVELLAKYPFDMDHRDRNWKTIIDLIEFTLNSYMDDIDKGKVHMCADYIYEKLESEPTLQFLIKTIEGSSNHSKYAWLLHEAKQTWDFNVTDDRKNTMLINAALLWDYKVVKTLVNYWADIYKKNIEWATALYLANWMLGIKPDIAEYKDIVSLLSSKDLSLWIKDIIGYMEDSIKYKSDSQYMHILSLIKKTWDINTVGGGWWNPILNIAISFWDEPLIKMLLKNWAKTDTINKKWQDTLEYSKEKWNLFYQNLMVLINDNKREEERLDKACSFLSKSNDSDVLDQLLLIKSSKNINIRNSSWDAILHLLAKKWDLDLFNQVFHLWWDMDLPDWKWASMVQCSLDWWNDELTAYINNKSFPF